VEAAGQETKKRPLAIFWDGRFCGAIGRLAKAKVDDGSRSRRIILSAIILRFGLGRQPREIEFGQSIVRGDDFRPGCTLGKLELLLCSALRS